jgi:hypothetical protein
MTELKKLPTNDETEGLEAGLPDDPVDLAIATAKADALELTRKTIRALLDCASEKNSARVLRAVENVASNQRDLISSLKGRKPLRKKRMSGRLGYRAVGEYLPDDADDDDEGGLVDATNDLVANWQAGDNETFGAQVMRQIVGFFRGPAEGLELKGLIESLKVAKDAGLTDEADQIKAKLKTLLGADASDLDLDDVPQPPLARPSVGPSMQVGYKEGNLVRTFIARAGLPRDAIGRVEAVNTVMDRTVLDIDFGGVVGERTMDASRVSLCLGGPDTKLYGEDQLGYSAGDLVEMPAWDLMDDGLGNSRPPDSPSYAVGRVHEVKEDDGATQLVIDFGGDIGRFEVPDVRVRLHIGDPDTKLYGEQLVDAAADAAALCSMGCGRELDPRQCETICDQCAADEQKCIPPQEETAAEEAVEGRS